MFRQSTNQKSLPGFRVVVTSLDGINGWSIQTLLKGENDSKQSDEFQARLVPATDTFIMLVTQYNTIYNIYRALIPNGPKALYIIKITTKS